MMMNKITEELINDYRLNNSITKHTLTNEQLKQVISDLKSFDNAYQQGKPLITDQCYDVIRAYAYQLNQQLHVSDYFNIAPSDIKLATKEYQHPYQVTSLAKTRDIDTLQKWLAKWQTPPYTTDSFIVEHKEDGLSVVMYFNDPNMPYPLTVLTRGGGNKGNDITSKAYHFINIDLNAIKKRIGKQHLVVRGECIINDNNFAELNTNDEYTSSRNLASGTLASLDDNLVAQRNLEFLSYDILNYQDFNFNVMQSLHYLSELGFVNTSHVKQFSNSPNGIKQLLDYVNNFDVTTVKHGIDGLVIKANNTASYQAIGYTQHHPRYAYAFKFPDVMKQAQIKAIEWSLSAKGKYTPVAILAKPVYLDGAYISRVSLGSYHHLQELNLMINDTVGIVRSQQVIPFIKHVYHNLRDDTCYPWQTPQDSYVKGAYLYANQQTTDILVLKYAHFVSNKGINLKGLAKQSIKKLVENNVLTDDFNSLWQAKTNPLTKELLGKNASLFDNLNDRYPLATILLALNINSLGKANVNTFITLKATPTNKNLLKAVNDFKDNYQSILNSLKNHIDFTVKYTDKPTLLTIAVTGKLPVKRSELANLPVKLGSVTKHTDYLVAEQASNSTKYQKAKQLKIPIISYQELLAILAKK